MIWITLFFISISPITGFLLDANTATNQAGNNQFLTLSEFYEEKKQQEEKFEHSHLEAVQLRHDVERMLSMLTSQVQQKFSALENQTHLNGPINETTKMFDDLIQKYKELQENNTKLQMLFDDLLIKYSTTERELMVLQNKTHDYGRSIEFSYNETERRATLYDNQFLQINNKSAELARQINDLQNLRNIKPLQDIQNMQQQLQSVSSQTHSLSVNEQARSQDFLALYNVTLVSKQEINNRIETMERDHNNTILKLTSNLEDKQKESAASCEQRIKDLEIFYNSSLALLANNLTESDEMVALTSCAASAYERSPGEIIKFDDVRTQIGINQLSTFKTSGKFTCEKDGLYQLSVFIASYNSGAYYSIFKNGNRLSQLYIASSSASTSYVHTGTAVVALLLQVGDTVWVQADTKMYVYTSTWSCLTIVKIK